MTRRFPPPTLSHDRSSGGASSFWNIPTLKRLSASAAALAFQLHPVAARDSLKPGFHSWRAGLLVFGTLQPRVSLARSQGRSPVPLLSPPRRARRRAAEAPVT